MLLLRYWKQHGQPRVIRTVPACRPTRCSSKRAAARRSAIGATVVRLERYAIDGVVWGRETVWLDEHGALAAAITRAGGLSFEAVREDLEPALVGFVAARDARSHRRPRSDHASASPPLKSGTYAMAGATIVDGTGRPPIADGVVVVRDGRIAEVGPRASVTIPAGMPTVAVDGKTIVPACGTCTPTSRRSSGRRSTSPPA